MELNDPGPAPPGSDAPEGKPAPHGNTTSGHGNGPVGKKNWGGTRNGWIAGHLPPTKLLKISKELNIRSG